MTRSTENDLRLFHERLETVECSAPRWPAALHDLCCAFERATGWSLSFAAGHPPQDDHNLLWSAPVAPGVGASPGHLRIDLGGPELREHGPAIDLDLAGELALAIGQLVGELNTASDALRKREAELAAGVPVVEHTMARPHLAERLEAVLRGGAQAVGCHAAAVYLLDAATSELKLRAAYGLPRERLSAPARALRASTADLEALAGHAVVMKNRAIRAEWGAPEASAAAVCVPVSSATMPLGTLWLYSARERDFSDEEVNLIEIVAGRLAADLEREMLMHEGVQAAALKRQVAEAERLQELQLPRVAPRTKLWDVDAWTLRGDRLGSDFFDWILHDDDALSIALGSASGSGISAALLSGMLQTALRAQAERGRDPATLVERLNRDLWQAAGGLQSASLGYALLDSVGRIRIATAGDVAAMVARPSGWQLLTRDSLALARDPHTRYQPVVQALRPEETLLIFSGGNLGARAGQLDHAAISRIATAHINSTARELAAILRLQCGLPAAGATRDRTLLVVKRRRK